MQLTGHLSTLFSCLLSPPALSLEVTMVFQRVRTSSFLLSLLGVVSGTPCTHHSALLMGPIFSAWTVDSKIPAHSHSNCCFFLREHVMVSLCLHYVIICLITIPSPTRLQFSYQRGSYPWILVTVFLPLAWCTAYNRSIINMLFEKFYATKTRSCFF